MKKTALRGKTGELTLPSWTRWTVQWKIFLSFWRDVHSKILPPHLLPRLDPLERKVRRV